MKLADKQMQAKFNAFITNNFKTVVTLSILVTLGGVFLAYMTNDSEPWGTIGGFISGLSLSLLLVASAVKMGGKTKEEGN